MTYNPKISFKKAGLAALYGAVGVLCADQNLLPWLVSLVPDQTVRLILGMAVPYAYAWGLNWWKNRNRTTA